ncbi:MAG: MerC domain-containing protein [Novosphingobium sp.]
MHPASPSIRERLDRFAVLLSGLCALHCVAGIVLVTVLGLGGGVLGSPAIHRVGIVLAILIGLVTLGVGTLRHGRAGPPLIGACGLSLMALAIVVGHGPAEALLTVPGVGLVALAHIRNLRAVRLHEAF